MQLDAEVVRILKDAPGGSDGVLGGVKAHLALFDFDGTLTTEDTFTRFLPLALPAWRMRAGVAVLSPLILAYKAGLLPTTLLRRAIVRVGFTGLEAAPVEAAAERFAREDIPGWLRPDAMERLHWHKDRGDDVAVVSASLDLYLGPWCREHGVALACSVLEQSGGRFTGRYLGKDCGGAAKAERVRERYDLSRYATIWAYGDTPEDAQLLALAGKRYYRGVELGEGERPGR